jgi:carbon-monoxide dehydrogenase medium subunit
VKPPPFKYTRPESLAEVIAILAEHGYDAKVLAGGQSLVPLLNMRFARPEVLVDITRVGELRGISTSDETWIGATTSQATVLADEAVRSRTPMLVEAMRWVAHPAIRNRGTLGGTVAHADPAAEAPAVVVALDGELTIQGPRGERAVDAEDFFQGSFTTALDPDEVLTGVRFPFASPARRFAFMEVARRHGDFAIAGVAAAADVDDSGRASSARIVLFGVDDRPVRAREAEARVEGEDLADESVRREAAALASEGLEPPADVHGTADYRRRVVHALVGRALDRMAGKENEWE